MKEYSQIMKILFVLEYYYPHMGGVEVLFKNLCEGLNKKGHEVTVLTTRLEETISNENINGVKVIRIKTPKILRRYFFTFLAIPKAIKLGKFVDLIQTTTYNGAFPAKLSSIINKKKSLITVHEIIGRDWSLLGHSKLFSFLHSFLENLIVKLNFDKYITVSKSTKRNLSDKKINPKKIEVVHNGIDYKLFDAKKYSKDAKDIRAKLGFTPKDFIVMFYGRPGISKGFEYLLNAVPKVLRKNNKIKFMFILAKSPQKRYEQFKESINKSEYKKNIVLVDQIAHKNIPKYIKASSCVVVPSLTEGFGFCVAESCSMNKIVIGSNTTSIPEVISGKYLLSKVKDSYSISKNILLAYEKKYKESKLKKFTWEDCINKYEKEYIKNLK